MPKSKDPDNASLLARCQEGDETAWRTLVERYEHLVYNVALRSGLDRQGAGEVFQQVWMELHKSLARIMNPQGLPKWLIVATRRIAYKEAMRQPRHRVEGVREDMVDPRALPDEELEDLQTRLRLEKELASLGEPCATLLRLLFLGGQKLSYREVSRRAKLPVGSIGPTRERCLKRLRRRMEDWL